jgi:hypothetical protein
VSPARTEKLGTLSASDRVRVLAEADALKRACTRERLEVLSSAKRQLRPGSHSAVTCCRIDWTADGNIEATEQTKDASAVQERVAAAHALLSS